MTKIYVGFSYPNKFKIGSAAIAWWMGVNYSHAYIRFESSDPSVPSNVYQASHGMCHFETFENFKKDNIVVKEYVIDVTPEVRKKTLINCMNLAGIGYGYRELVQIFLMDLANYIGRDLHFDNDPGYICSELVGKLCQDDLGMTFNKPLNILKPIDLDLALADKYKLLNP